MKEKKLTDEEIVKALDICYNSPCCTNECPYFNESGRNFCVENKAIYKDLKRIVLEHSEQKAEIERLTEESDEMFDRHAKENQAASILIEKRNNEIAELQKQVDELKEENEYLDMVAKQSIADSQNLQVQVDELLNRRIEPKTFHCHADALENCPKVEKAVKDTAKEIWNDITSYYFSLRVIGNATVELDKLAEFWYKCGVEVE